LDGRLPTMVVVLRVDMRRLPSESKNSKHYR
jgi:hypothetical protein